MCSVTSGRARATAREKKVASLVGTGRRKTLGSVADASITAYLLPPCDSASGLLRVSGGSGVARNGRSLRPALARNGNHRGDEAVAGPQNDGESARRLARRQGIGAGGEVLYYIVVRCR